MLNKVTNSKDILLDNVFLNPKKKPPIPKEECAKKRIKVKLRKILFKFYSGIKLTPDELQFLAKHAPEIYEKFKMIMAQQQEALRQNTVCTDTDTKDNQNTPTQSDGMSYALNAYEKSLDYINITSIARTSL